MELKEKIGMSEPPYEVEVTEDQIARFCEATKNRFRSGIAPPTFPTVFRKAEFSLLAKTGFRLDEVLHADQSYEHLGDIRAGDKVRLEAKLKNAAEKKGKAIHLIFLTFETLILNAATRSPLARSETTLVVKKAV